MKRTFLSCLLLLWMVVTANAQIVKGDMNNDGVVDISDVVSIVNTILGSQPVEEISISDLLKGQELTFTTEDGETVVLTGEQLTALVPAHAYVDLGLTSRTKWATTNIGADSPEEYGDYFSWGETQGYDGGKTTFFWDNYKHSEGSKETLTKYCYNSDCGYNGFTDKLKELEPEDDAAYVNWGSNWRMPTSAQWEELHDECTWTWIEEGRKVGFEVSSKKNGNSIFLPAAGYRTESALYTDGTNGCYWSCSLYDNGVWPYYAIGIGLKGSLGVDFSGFSRHYGFSVRPVRPR